MSEEKRIDGRYANELRPITFQLNIAPKATGSVLVGFGNTQVICSAMIEKRVPAWLLQSQQRQGWLSAEYTMLPYATQTRKSRERNKTDKRSIEIQRLIGRCLRTAVDLTAMPGMSLCIDCDVLEADGGTRTAAISGAWLAAQYACKQLLKDGVLQRNPIKDSVAAVSVGIWEGLEVLDLCYHEDAGASADLNVVFNGAQDFIEIQGTGEQAAFSQQELDSLLQLAKKGAKEITEIQQKTLASIEHG